MRLLLLTILWIGCNGCAAVQEMAAPVANFALGLYNADTYITKECAWYEEIKFTQETKTWFKQANPPAPVITDLQKVSRNNDLYREICQK